VERPQQQSVDEVVFGDPFTEQLLTLASRVASTALNSAGTS